MRDANHHADAIRMDEDEDAMSECHKKVLYLLPVPGNGSASSPLIIIIVGCIACVDFSLITIRE